MMQLIENGEPKLFRHECPQERKGQYMTEEEYHDFLVDMVFQNFLYCQSNIVKYSKKSGCITPDLCYKESLGIGSPDCDYIVIPENTRFEDVNVSHLSCCYNENKWLKLLRVTARTICPYDFRKNSKENYPFINGDLFVVKIEAKFVFPQLTLANRVPTHPHEIIKNLCKSWEMLDESIIESYLDDDLLYKSDQVFAECNSRFEYMHYIKHKFDTIKNSPNNSRKVGIAVNKNNEIVGIFIKLGFMESCAYLETIFRDGYISTMIMHELSFNPFENNSIKR